MKVPDRDDLWFRVNPSFEGTRKSLLGRLLCGHPRTSKHVLIDSTTGPGWMNTNYHIRACTRCGSIVHKERIEQ